MMSKSQAETLVRQINETAHPFDLIVEAFQGEAHLALGHQTWREFVEVELPRLRYTPASRRRVALRMTQAGMSPRSVAIVLGVDEGTVVADTKPRQPRKNRQARATRGAQIKKRVEEYREVVARHPTWSPRAIQDHLRLSQPKEVTRLRMYAQAPGEVQEALYSGQITPAVVEAVLGNQYASDEDKLTVLLKVISGVITSTGTPRMREIMALIPEMQPYADLRLRWRSPDVAMTAEQLQEELIDIRNSRAASKRERAQQAAEDRMMVEAGFNALGWLDQVAEQMDLVEQMWPVLNANPWVQQRLAIKMDRIADRMRALTQPEEQPDSDPEPLVIIQAE